MKYLSLFGVAFVTFMPDLVLAQAGGLVPCGGTDCSLCSFAQMGNTILQWLIGVLFVVFAVMVAVAGFGLVTSGGNPSAKQAAKDKLVNALVGIIIVLAAWLIVDTLIRGLVGTSGQINGRLWHTVTCQTQRTPTTVAPGFPPPVAGQFSYQVYEEDTTNSCKIAHFGSDPVQSNCSAAQSADIASINAAGNAYYIVQDCDPAATLTPPPTWSNLPACGIPSTACTPLTPYTGPDPLGVVWTGADPGLQNCAQQFAASAGGVINSAVRPQPYQDHLKEIHTKWCAQGLSQDPACSEYAAVQAEFNQHGLNCSWPVANISNHTAGLSVDITFPGGDPGTAGTYNFSWFGMGDPVHYTFTAGATCP